MMYILLNNNHYVKIYSQDSMQHLAFSGGRHIEPGRYDTRVV